MAVSESMFLFEVVLENVTSLVESKAMVVRADFADVFSLDLKDPKQLNLVIPQPPPPSPEPAGKGKKGKAKAPKPKKGKGKAVAEPPPPPEPIIQSGQSVLFASSGEILLATMKKNPLLLSLWSKEDDLRFIGSANITWDNQYLNFLDSICKCQKPQPLTLRGDYNIFNEETAKLMATVTLQIKLTFLEDKITSQFRTVPNLVSGTKKCLYTGIHSKNTSYMCSLKMSEPIEELDPDSPKEETENPHIESTFVRDAKPKEIRFADYKNAQATNTTFFSDDADYCCMGKADKPPISTYKAPKVMPDLIDMADYVSKVIRSCNENLRMLTPQLEIKPRHRATDIDRLCGCNRDWPDSNIGNLMNDPVNRLPCAMCTDPAKPDEHPHAFELHNIRGPCGKVECKVAKTLRTYIEELAIEDNKEVNLDEIVGPCGSKTCTLADRIQKFIKKEGVFSEGQTLEGLSTICACEDKLKQSLKRSDSCNSQCSNDCGSDTNDSNCSSKNCAYNYKKNNTYCVGYCTIVNNANISNIMNAGADDSHQNVCKSDCPAAKDNKDCSKDICDVPSMSIIPCTAQVDCSKTCLSLTNEPFVHGNDSNIEINLEDINNPCCVKSCDVADKVKDFIVEGAKFSKCKPKSDAEGELCYCDCECKFGFTTKTTYCAVCGGYEVEGSDLRDKPPFEMPAPPCPIYHKLYDKNKFKLNPGWSDPTNEPKSKKSMEDVVQKGSKPAKINESPSKATTVIAATTGTSGSHKPGQTTGKDAEGGDKKFGDKKAPTKKDSNSESQPEGGKKAKRPVTKFTFNYGYKGIAPTIGHSRCHLPFNARGGRAVNTPVPKNMGWLWTAEDVPGMKYRQGWRPGAANKRVVNLLRHHQNPEIALKKKRQREMKTKTKVKLEKKPLLTIHKKDGEYKVTMETLRIYPKPRHYNQYPYEDKAPETFIVGRTDQENARREKRLQRENRRKERAERQFLQQSFRNTCEEICMSTYRQAIGILKSHEIPECPCFPDQPDVINIDSGHSCSCSDSYSSSGSETDGDEWVIEVTPPVAKYDPKYKPPCLRHSTSSQYNYLDFKVKLVGFNGNPVPRFFRGPDGKEVCSDLGGFWSPTGEWLQIGVDGYVAPDGRWVPNTFIGPDGQIIDARAGKFQGPDGEWLVIGVDGYVDADGKWVYDPPRPPPRPRSPWRTRSDSTWSCFGDVPPATLAERGIVGHSRDRKLLLERLKELQATGIEVHFPKMSEVPRCPYRPKTPPRRINWEERYKCRHPLPSDKGYTIDSEGNIVYFTTASKIHGTVEERMRVLQEQGIGMCGYHMTCFDSLIGCREFKEMMKSRGDGSSRGSPNRGSHKFSKKGSPKGSPKQNEGDVLQTHGYNA